MSQLSKKSRQSIGPSEGETAIARPLSVGLLEHLIGRLTELTSSEYECYLCEPFRPYWTDSYDVRCLAIRRPQLPNGTHPRYVRITRYRYAEQSSSDVCYAWDYDDGARDDGWGFTLYRDGRFEKTESFPITEDYCAWSAAGRHMPRTFVGDGAAGIELEMLNALELVILTRH